MSSTQAPKVEVRPALASDVDWFSEATKYRSFRGIVATIDGEPHAIAGLSFHPGGNVIAFSEMREGLEPYLVAIARMAQEFVKLMAGDGRPIFAIKSPSIPKAARFLEWCGFEHHSALEIGEVYQWRP